MGKTPGDKSQSGYGMNFIIVSNLALTNKGDTYTKLTMVILVELQKQIK